MSSIAQILPGGRYAVGVDLKAGINFGTALLTDLRTGDVSAFETPVVEIVTPG